MVADHTTSVSDSKYHVPRTSKKIKEATEDHRDNGDHGEHEDHGDHGDHKNHATDHAGKVRVTQLTSDSPTLQ